jgi:hypothetical protein
MFVILSERSESKACPEPAEGDLLFDTLRLGWVLIGCVKMLTQQHEVSGHGFSRAVNAKKYKLGFSP